jgi:hypothetical protein
MKRIQTLTPYSTKIYDTYHDKIAETYLFYLEYCLTDLDKRIYFNPEIIKMSQIQTWIE